MTKKVYFNTEVEATAFANRIQECREVLDVGFEEMTIDQHIVKFWFTLIKLH